MQFSIKKDLSGIGIRHRHREDLKRLDRGFEHFKQYKLEVAVGAVQERKKQYSTLKGVSLDVDRTVMNKLLTGMSSCRPIGLNQYTNITPVVGRVQSPIQPLVVFSNLSLSLQLETTTRRADASLLGRAGQLPIRVSK